MEGGATFDEALAEAQRRGFAEADPTDDLSGADAAAKMAILATIAFGSRVALDDVEYQGLEELPPGLPAAARELEMVVRLVGAATLIDDEVDERVPRARRPSPSACRDRGGVQRGHAPGRRHPRDHARGAGCGGSETASAVVADMVGIIGTTGTGFLHNDPCWRTLQRMPPGNLRSPFYVHLEVDDQPGVLADVSQRLAAHDVSVARLTQVPAGSGATLHVVLHEAPQREVDGALAEIAQLPQVHGAPSVLPVSDRGVVELGWA